MNQVQYSQCISQYFVGCVFKIQFLKLFQCTYLDDDDSFLWKELGLPSEDDANNSD